MLALMVGNSLKTRTSAFMMKGRYDRLIPFSFAAPLQRAAKSSQPSSVKLFDIGEMRDGAVGLDHLLGDLTTQPDDLDRLVGPWVPRRRDGIEFEGGGRNAPPVRCASMSDLLTRPSLPEPATH